MINYLVHIFSSTKSIPLLFRSAAIISSSIAAQQEENNSSHRQRQNSPQNRNKKSHRPWNPSENSHVLVPHPAPPKKGKKEGKPEGIGSLLLSPPGGRDFLISSRRLFHAYYLSSPHPIDSFHSFAHRLIHPHTRQRDNGKKVVACVYGRPKLVATTIRGGARNLIRYFSSLVSHLTMKVEIL